MTAASSQKPLEKSKVRKTTWQESHENETTHIYSHSALLLTFREWRFICSPAESQIKKIDTTLYLFVQYCSQKMVRFAWQDEKQLAVG